MAKRILYLFLSVIITVITIGNTFGQECLPPDFAFVDNENITSTSAFIEWEDYNNSTSWDIVVSPIMLSNPATGNVVNVQHMYYQAQNLNPQTIYYIYLRSHCGNEVSDWMDDVPRFTTLCAPQNIPYSETFTSSFPTCWTSILSTDPTMGYSGGTYVMQLRNSCAVALPLFTQPINTLRLNFDARFSNTSSQLVVGVMEVLNDWSTFTPIDTITAATANTFAAQEIHFNSYNGNGEYIVLSWDGTSNNCQIKNVVVSVLPNCLNPVNLMVSNLTANAVTLTWTEVGSATSWQGILSQTSITNFNTQTPMNFNTTPTYSQSSLSPNTTYYFYVRSVCSSTEYSEWTSVTFTTSCGNTILPFSESFTTPGVVPDCWEIQHVAGNALPTIVAGGQNPFTSPAAGAAMVQWASSGYSTGQEARLVAQPISTIGVSTLDVNFMWHHDSGAPTALNEGVQIQYSFDGTNWNNTTQGLIARYSELFNGWTEYDVYIPEASGHSVVYVGFLFRAQHGQNCFLDEINFRNITGCLPPAGINVTDITGNSANISWTEVGNAQQWNVVISETPLSNPSSGSVTPVTTTSYQPSSLNPTTTYYVYVQSVCSGSSSDWSRYVTFTTDCGTILQLPYFESFDTYTTGSYPTCWTRPTTHIYQSYTAPCVVDINAVDGDNSLMICTASNNYSYVISPAIREDIHNVTATFFIYQQDAEYSGSVEIGVMTDFQDMASFEPVDTIVPTAQGSWQFFRVDFSQANTTGQNRYIAFRHHAVSDFNYYLIDEVSIEHSEDCWHAVNLEVTDITGNSATFHWLDANTPAASWHLKMSETPLANMNMPAHVVDTLINTNTFTINYLNGGTTYYYYIYPDCGSNTGNFVNGELTTLPCNCFVKFYLFDDFGNGWEGARIQMRQGNLTIGEVTLSDGAADTITMYACNAGNIDFWYLAGNYDSDNSFFIENNHGMEIYHSAGTPTAGCFTSRSLDCGVTCNATPSNVTATNIPGGARITWGAAAEAQTYAVYRNGNLIADYIPTTYYVDNAMVSGENCYTVAATCIVGESNQSSSSCVVGVDEYDMTKHFTVYPNPAHDKITVSADFVIDKISIYNMVGQQVWGCESAAEQVDIALPFSNGIYLLKVWKGDKCSTQKLIIQK